MRLHLLDDLPFVIVTISHRGTSVDVPSVLGFDLGGILGMDFLFAAGAILNLRELTLEFAPDR